MNLKELLNAIYPWRQAGLYAFVTCFVLGGAVALVRPLQYESQAILERKPVRLAPQLDPKEGEEFDVYRLTSESQRCVALMKSRYMLELWYDALRLPARSPLQKERGMGQLKETLTVQPISYTDLFVVKVRANSPEAAHLRAGKLIEIFSKWDLYQDRHEAEQLVALLRNRLRQLTTELVQNRAKLEKEQGSSSISLVGSASSRQMEADIAARTGLYDRLTAELEGAERELSNDAVARTRVLAPPATPAMPITSRKAKLFIVFCLSVLLSFGFMFWLEWLKRSGFIKGKRVFPEVPERTKESAHIRS